MPGLGNSGGLSSSSPSSASASAAPSDVEATAAAREAAAKAVAADLAAAQAVFEGVLERFPGHAAAIGGLGVGARGHFHQQHAMSSRHNR